MQQLNNIYIRSVIILLISVTLTFANFSEVQAKKKNRKAKNFTRHYNPTATKKMSLEMLRKNPELAQMANLAPIIDGEEITVDENNQIIGDLGEDLAELEKEDNFEYDAEQFQMLLMSLIDNETTAAGITKSAILNEAIGLLGTRYKFGGSSTKGFDCSAFTRYIYYKVASIILPRTAREQINVGKVIKRKEDLQFGDLIFFHTYSKKFASHVGIYLNDGLFVHSGTRYGVAFASLNSEFYKKRFIGGRRLTEKDIENLRIKAKEQDIQAFRSSL